jgi:hypothetical protein
MMAFKVAFNQIDLIMVEMDSGLFEAIEVVSKKLEVSLKHSFKQFIVEAPKHTISLYQQLATSYSLHFLDFCGTYCLFG